MFDKRERGTLEHLDKSSPRGSSAASNFEDVVSVADIEPLIPVVVLIVVATSTCLGLSVDTSHDPIG